MGGQLFWLAGHILKQIWSPRARSCAIVISTKNTLIIEAEFNFSLKVQVIFVFEKCSRAILRNLAGCIGHGGRKFPRPGLVILLNYKESLKVEVLTVFPTSPYTTFDQWFKLRCIINFWWRTLQTWQRKKKKFDCFFSPFEMNERKAFRSVGDEEGRNWVWLYYSKFLIVQGVSRIYTNVARWLFLSHFWPLLKWASIYEAAKKSLSPKIWVKKKKTLDGQQVLVFTIDCQKLYFCHIINHRNQWNKNMKDKSIKSIRCNKVSRGNYLNLKNICYWRRQY